MSYKALGYTQVTGLSASTGLSIPAGTTLILVTPETQAVRWRDDGTAPTGSVGYPLPVGAELRYIAEQMAALRFIEQLPSAKLNVVFYSGKAS